VTLESENNETEAPQKNIEPWGWMGCLVFLNKQLKTADD